MRTATSRRMSSSPRRCWWTSPPAQSFNATVAARAHIQPPPPSQARKPAARISLFTAKSCRSPRPSTLRSREKQRDGDSVTTAHDPPVLFNNGYRWLIRVRVGLWLAVFYLACQLLDAALRFAVESHIVPPSSFMMLWLNPSCVGFNPSYGSNKRPNKPNFSSSP